jgi:hypothetical protein
MHRELSGPHAATVSRKDTRMKVKNVESQIDSMADGAKDLVARANVAATRVAEKTVRAADGAEAKIQEMARKGERTAAKTADKVGHVVAHASSKVVRAAQEVAQTLVHDAKELASKVEGTGGKKTPR